MRRRDDAMVNSSEDGPSSATRRRALAVAASVRGDSAEGASFDKSVLLRSALSSIDSLERSSALFFFFDTPTRLMVLSRAISVLRARSGHWDSLSSLPRTDNLSHAVTPDLVFKSSICTFLSTRLYIWRKSHCHCAASEDDS